MGRTPRSPERCSHKTPRSWLESQSKKVSVSHGGRALPRIHLDQAKVGAIASFRIPKTKKDVRAFLGLTGYYTQFIPRFATLSAGLSDQTKKQKPNNIQWTPELEQDFNTLKEELCEQALHSSNGCLREGNWCCAESGRQPGS